MIQLLNVMIVEWIKLVLYVWNVLRVEIIKGIVMLLGNWLGGVVIVGILRRGVRLAFVNNTQASLRTFRFRKK